MTRPQVLAAIYSVPSLGGEPLGWAIQVAGALYPDLAAGSVEQLAEQLVLRGWTRTGLQQGAYWQDGQGDCGFVLKVVLNDAGSFFAASSAGHYRRPTAGLAFCGAPG